MSDDLIFCEFCGTSDWHNDHCYRQPAPAGKASTNRWIAEDILRGLNFSSRGWERLILAIERALDEKDRENRRIPHDCVTLETELQEKDAQIAKDEALLRECYTQIIHSLGCAFPVDINAACNCLVGRMKERLK